MSGEKNSVTNGGKLGLRLKDLSLIDLLPWTDLHTLMKELRADVNLKYKRFILNELRPGVTSPYK